MRPLIRNLVASAVGTLNPADGDGGGGALGRDTATFFSSFGGLDGSTTFTNDGSGTYVPTSVWTAAVSTDRGIDDSNSLLINNGALRIDNTSGNVDDFGSGDFTIQTWYYSNGFTPFEHVAARYMISYSSRRCWRIFRGAAYDDWTFFLGNGNTSPSELDINYPVDITNTWIHIAMCRDGDTLRAYMDGVEVGNMSVAGRVPNYASSTFAQIGARQHSNTNPYESTNAYFDLFQINKECLYPDGTTFVPPTT